MKLLVLGSEGVIGRYLVAHARAAGHEVTESDILLPPYEDLRKAYNPTVWEKMENCDLVFFLAFDVGGAHYLAKRQRTKSYLDSNLLLMINTFEMLYLTSKPFIFGSSQMSNMVESPYGILKRIGEFYTDSTNGMNVRFWNVYGHETDPKKFHVITDVINMARVWREIHLSTDGTEVRQFLYAPDAADALLKLAERYDDLDRGPNIFYDVTSFQWHTIMEVAEFVASCFPDTTVVPGIEKDHTQTLRNEPTERIWDIWTPTISIWDGIKDLIGKD